MKNKQILFAFLLFIISYASQAQDNTEAKPTYYGTVSFVEYVSSMSSRPEDLLPPDDAIREAKDKRSISNQLSLGQDPIKTVDDYFVRNRHELEQNVSRAPASLVFDTYSSNSQPTDPSLAIGPNHVFVVYNTGFMIYGKAGNLLQGQTSPNPAIFPAGGCCDLTVSYDNAADRWVISFLSTTAGAQIAISDGPNPITSGWYVYTVSAVQDYQKLSVWSDGYYITENTSGSNKVWALERSAMLAGNPGAKILGFNLPGIATSGFFSPQVLNVTDSNLPAAGGATVVYMQDNAWSGVSSDHIKVWTIDVDWANTANSSISAAQQIPVTPFTSVFDNGSFSNLTQPGGGTAIDALQATIMNQAQFRKFASHNSAVFNFVVDADGSSGELAAIRWIEFRQNGDNQPWSLYQEGTYTAPDGRHAWNASLAMDGSGNIGMGYTSMSGASTPSTVRVSSYFTGRLSTDPLGTMTSAEGLIANGNANIPGTRYGDYGKIDVDPSDDSSFWFITEYMNSGRKGVIGKFALQAGPPDTEVPTDPTNLVASNITSAGATLNWTASTDNVGVSLYSISIDGSVVGTSTDASFTVTGLSPLTAYTASVIAQDVAGNVSGSATTTFTTLEGGAVTYCSSESTNINDEFIGRVQLNTIDNASGGQFYTDFTSISTSLTEGDSYTVTVTPTWTGTIYPEGYAVWIDYNNDGDFTDSGELVWSKEASTNTPNSGSFTVPNGTSRNSTRMRVSMKYAGVPTSCETFNFGEVEDYTINLEAAGGGSAVIAGYYFETGLEGWVDGGADCDRIENSNNSYEGTYSIRIRNNTSSSNAASPILDLSGNTQVTIEFHTYSISMESGEDFFVEFYNGSSYEVIGHYVSGTDFSNDVFFTDTIVLNASLYDFNSSNRFRFRNDAGDNSDKIFFDQVIISGENIPDTQPPAAPASLSASNITDTTVDLSWNASSDNVGVTGYEIFKDGISVGTITGTSATANGLTANTSYSFNVRAFDAAGNNSELSNTVNVTTIGGGGGGTSVIAGYYFETGLEGWVDGGADCDRIENSNNSYEGIYSIRIRNNTSSSNAASPILDLSGNTQVTIEFHTYSISMESGEDFFVEFYNGSSYEVIGHYVSGTDFGNDVFFTDTIVLNASLYDFNSSNRFRFRNDAGDNSDKIFFDQVIISGENIPDTQPPAAPASLSASNITDTTVDLSWNASSDNVGVTGYEIFKDGISVGTITGTSATANGLTANTSYSFNVRAFDAAGNNSELSNTVNVTTIGGGGGGSSVIAGYYFETGLEGWVDGGADCDRIENSNNSYEGTYSIRIRNNTSSSNATSPILDLSGNTQVTIEFHTYSISMESGEDFFVEFYNGSSYEVIGHYVSGTDFSNDVFFTDTIVLNASLYDFNSSNRFRFRNDAGDNSDKIFFDQVIISGENIPDTQPPAAPASLSASNITDTTVDLSWNASSDNVGVTGYEIFKDGISVGTITGTSATANGLTANTSYSFNVRAFDAAGNNSELSNTVNVTTIGGGGGGSSVIAGYYFETGLEGWVDGGADCDRIENSNNSYEGTYSIRIRNNTSSSNATSPILDLSGNTQVTIEFHTYSISMESGEDFFVEFYNGSSYEVIGHYVSGTDFSNDVFFTDTIVLNASLYDFNSSNRFRFRNDAGDNSDKIFFDQVIISGDNIPSLTPLFIEESAQELRSFTRLANENIKLYPNPAKEMLNIEILEGSYDEITVFSALGGIVHKAETGVDRISIDVSQLSAGMYFIRFVSNGLAVTKRFVKE